LIKVDADAHSTIEEYLAGTIIGVFVVAPKYTYMRQQAHSIDQQLCSVDFTVDRA
jgi:hypothetical protein